MAGENGGDCGVLALTAPLQVAHKGTTMSRLRYISVCVKEREKKGKADDTDGQTNKGEKRARERREPDVSSGFQLHAALKTGGGCSGGSGAM